MTTRRPASLDERALVEAARVDAEAFAELYRRYLTQVHAFAWRRTGSVQAAEDITSATFEAALADLHRFRWRPGGFGPWLFGIAAHQTVAHHRREGRPRTGRGAAATARLHTGDAGTDAFTRVEDRLSIDHEALRRALDRLPDRYQRAIALRHLADLAHDEAARAMGLTRPAFAVLLSRATAALRRELGRDTEGAPHHG